VKGASERASGRTLLYLFFFFGSVGFCPAPLPGIAFLSLVYLA
jgi:hypothetical protein